MSSEIRVFDRTLLRRRRDRVAPGLREYDFLFREIAERVADRLDDVKRSFPLALDLGCHDGTLGRVLRERGGIETLVQGDLSPAMANAAAKGGQPSLALDEEALPFKEASFDLVISAMSLHWANDLPGVLAQIRQALRPDGLFLAAFVGGESLWQLRQAWVEAEMSLEPGVSPHVAPFALLADGAALLQRAGFALPVADLDRINVTYPSALTLMRDLRGMGESNALLERRRSFTRSATLLEAADIYEQKFANAEGRIDAHFEIVFLTGWAPAASQPKALRPGSAEARLADALDTKERSSGVKVPRKGS